MVFEVMKYNGLFVISSYIAAPHFALAVRDWLDTTFPECWLGRRGPHEWPARIPDLTPCDFFLWGWAKEEVYKVFPRLFKTLRIKLQKF